MWMMCTVLAVAFLASARTAWGKGGGKNQGSGSSAPPPPPPPKAEVAKPVSEAATAARAAQRDKAAKAGGIRGTIMTSPLGDAGQQAGQAKTLLGQ